MDESEAKYIFDQFNKFCSWSVKGYEPRLSEMAIGIAMLALLLSALNALKFLPDLLMAVVCLVIIGGMFFHLFEVRGFVHRITQVHKNNLNKLILLDNYRCEHKSLPDGLTFERIAKAETPEALKKLLQTNAAKTDIVDECKGCALGIVLGVVVGEEPEKERARQLLRKDGVDVDNIEDYVVYKNEKVIINHSFNPITLGHLVIQPVRCQNPSDEIHDYEHREVENLFKFARLASKALQEELKPERVYLWSFNEQQREKSNWHLHVHVAPKSCCCLSGSEWLTAMERAEKKVNKGEIKELVKKLRGKEWR